MRINNIDKIMDIEIYTCSDKDICKYLINNDMIPVKEYDDICIFIQNQDLINLLKKYKEGGGSI
jgi:hypothetical protein